MGSEMCIRDSSTPAAGAQRVQNLFFPVTLTLEKRTISTDGEEIPISNGMAVTVEIKTGSRTIISYLLSPLRKYRQDSLRER